MTRPPSGTVTFLFTDIQGSTKLWQAYPRGMRAAVARHDALLKSVVAANRGLVFKTVGDAICAAFETAQDSLAAAIAAQLALGKEHWDLPSPILVRMALHTGEAEERDDDYFGPALNRVARLLAIGHGGQTLLSLVTAELVRDTLPDGVSLRDMGEHRLKDLYRPEAVFQVLHPDLPSDFPALNSLDVHPHNLPVQPTPFIGREALLDAIGAALARDDVRLLTVTGPGGMGKTRVALQAAADAIERFPGGAWFVDLAPLTDPAHLAGAVARVLRVKEGGGGSLLERLVEHLRERRLLLVLDNFEQLMPAAPQVAAILAACPAVKIVVTSREPLAVRGEQVHVLPPLSLPPALPRQGTAVSSVTQYEAVRLFVERATAVDDAFRVSNETAPAIAAICAKLDGIPLAIELAAARVRLLSPGEILRRLEHRLGLLVTTMRDLPERQRTLRATIEWSHGLLDERLKALLRALSPFAGGFSLEAAERVAAMAVPAAEILDGVEALAARSLLVRERGPDGETRLRMLETIREFALERLDEGSDAEALRLAHADCYAAMAAAARFEGPRQKEWLDRTDVDYENIRAALAHLQASGERAAFVAMAADLAPFWAIRCRLNEGTRWLSRALELLDGLPDDLRARALAAAGVMARQAGEYDRSTALLEQALPLCGAADVRRARVLCDLGRTLYRKNDLERAWIILTDSMECALALGSPVTAAIAGLGIGTIEWQQGRLDDAVIRFEQCRLVFSLAGWLREEAQAVNNVGLIHYERGNMPAALGCFEGAKLIQEQLGNWDDLVKVLFNLADVRSRIGYHDAARELYRQLIVHLSNEGESRWLAIAYAGLADVHLGGGSMVEARAAADLATREAEHFPGGLEQGIVLRLLGDIALVGEGAREAKEWYERSIPLLEAARDQRELAKACCGREYAIAAGA